MEGGCRQLEGLRRRAHHVAQALQVREIAVCLLRTPWFTLPPSTRSGAVTDDLRCALAFLSHFAPHAPLYGIGFSLGANQMAKLVGEDAEKSPLNAAVVLGAPFDFVKGHVSLSSSWIRLVYSRAMGKNLKCVLLCARDEPFED